LIRSDLKGMKSRWKDKINMEFRKVGSRYVNCIVPADDHAQSQFDAAFNVLSRGLAAVDL
jgi:hypothetical protein